LLVEFREWLGRPDIEATARFLHLVAGLGQDLEEATKTFNTMLDHGSRYKQLEGYLGVGVLFVLPTNIGETNWTRIITKTTNRMTEAVRQLSSTSIPGLATHYALLRQRVVGGMMNELWTTWCSAQPPITMAVMPQQCTVSLSHFAQPATWGGQTTQFVMENDAFEQEAFGFE